MSEASLTFAERLDRLGEVAVKVGLNLQAGQELVISAPLEAVPLVRRLTEHAYKAGASLVTAQYSDDEATLARYRFATDDSLDTSASWMADGIARAYREGAARLAITGGNPTLLNGQDPTRVSRASRAASRANREAMEIITRFDTNWTIVAFATASWAAQVFPDLSGEQAQAKLWDAIFASSRLDTPDPVLAWKQHNATLHAKAAMLNERRFDSLHFTGPGTDLHVGLADGHAWAGGAEHTTNGIECNPNIPTEEVFTTPHSHRVSGHVASTKPLFHQGTLIDEIRVTFAEGRIVEAHASKGEDALKRILDTDEGAARLGEVALVPHASPISDTGILFRNTLFDENASSHIALGQAYTKCMLDTDGTSPDALAARGANSSMIHIDWMIGSDKIDLDGAYRDGTKIPLMRKGAWV